MTPEQRKNGHAKILKKRRKDITITALAEAVELVVAPRLLVPSERRSPPASSSAASPSTSVSSPWSHQRREARIVVSSIPTIDIHRRIAIVPKSLDLAAVHTASANPAIRKPRSSSLTPPRNSATSSREGFGTRRREGLGTRRPRTRKSTPRARQSGASSARTLGDRRLRRLLGLGKPYLVLSYRHLRLERRRSQ